MCKQLPLQLQVPQKVQLFTCCTPQRVTKMSSEEVLKFIRLTADFSESVDTVSRTSTQLWMPVSNTSKAGNKWLAKQKVTVQRLTYCED